MMLCTPYRILRQHLHQLSLLPGVRSISDPPGMALKNETEKEVYGRDTTSFTS